MPSVYAKVSDNGRLPALARQLMYAARPIIQKRTGKLLDSKYFTQTLLPDYIAEFGCEDWLVVYDARGHLYEPHTDLMVPLGTLAVRQHLKDANGLIVKPEEYKLTGKLYPTMGPRNRYGDVLFLEKEGFHPLLNAVKLQERRDIAVMSTKGMSVTAARELIDSICARTNNGVPVRLLVLHDRQERVLNRWYAQRATRRYAFQNDVKVIDLGLRVGRQARQRRSIDIAGWASPSPKKDQTRNDAVEPQGEQRHRAGDQLPRAQEASCGASS
jgi:hypothetical protein